MMIPTIVMGLVAIILLFIAYNRGEAQSGLRLSFSMILKVLPILVFSFIVAGMIQVLVPMKVVAQWIGEEAGFRGILIGSIAGGFAPGAPYFGLPIVAAFLKSGAGIGTMVAFFTGWTLLAFGRIPLEVGIVGWKFALIRFSCTFFFPPIAGLLAHNLVKLLRS